MSAKPENTLHERYELEESWGISTNIDLHSCDPELIRSKEYIKAFALELCQAIGAVPFGECLVVRFGEREEIKGFSMIQLIESSLLSAHFAESTNAAYIDIFSCKYYDPYDAARFCKAYFNGKDCNIQITLRK